MPPSAAAAIACSSSPPHWENAGADELELESDLRRSLINDQMTLFYQPQVACRTGELVGRRGAAALAASAPRAAQPEEFISAAEESGFILPLGQWVLEKACEEARLLQERLGEAHHDGR